MATPQISTVQETPVQMVWMSGHSLVWVQGYSQTCCPAIASLMQTVGQPQSELFWQGLSSLAASCGLHPPPLELPLLPAELPLLLAEPLLLLLLVPPVQASAQVHASFSQTGWQKQPLGQVQAGGGPEQPAVPLLPLLLPAPPMQKPSSGSMALGAMQVSPVGQGTEPFGLQTCSQMAPAQKSPAMQSCERFCRVAVRLQLDVAWPPW
jgi:hypothetical protein